MLVHHTATSTDPWDADARSDSPDDFAWADGDDRRFLHHSGDAANMDACLAGIRALNASDLSDADRPAVWRHLAAHLRDGMGEDYEPPALRARFRQARELRFTAEPGLEVREASDGGPIITGHAAVFNKWSEDLGGYRERINPGAFAKTITDGADVRALFNHDPNFVLGRTKSATLDLEEDKRGLRFENRAPDTGTIQDLVISPIRRGDVSQCSFAFRAIQQEWNADCTERTLLECGLFDVSPVTFPAYPQTDAQVRNILSFVGLDFDTLTAAMAKAERGFEPTKTDLEQINGAITTLRSLIPVRPAPKDHLPEPTKAGRSVAHLRRLLALEAETLD